MNKKRRKWCTTSMGNTCAARKCAHSVYIQPSCLSSSSLVSLFHSSSFYFSLSLSIDFSSSDQPWHLLFFISPHPYHLHSCIIRDHLHQCNVNRRSHLSITKPNRQCLIRDKAVSSRVALSHIINLQSLSHGTLPDKLPSPLPYDIKSLIAFVSLFQQPTSIQFHPLQLKYTLKRQHDEVIKRRRRKAIWVGDIIVTANMGGEGADC